MLVSLGLRGGALLVTRTFSSSTAAALSREQRMMALLTEKLQAERVEVKDVSGGCGDFFQITVISPLFKGMPVVKQHRAVNEVLAADVGKMHGLTIKTGS